MYLNARLRIYITVSNSPKEPQTDVEFSSLQTKACLHRYWTRFKLVLPKQRWRINKTSSQGLWYFEKDCWMTSGFNSPRKRNFVDEMRCFSTLDDSSFWTNPFVAEPLCPNLSWQEWYGATEPILLGHSLCEAFGKPGKKVNMSHFSKHVHSFNSVVKEPSVVN